MVRVDTPAEIRGCDHQAAHGDIQREQECGQAQHPGPDGDGVASCREDVFKNGCRLAGNAASSNAAHTSKHGKDPGRSAGILVNIPAPTLE